MDQLEIHVRSHYTDRPYICTKCDKSYKDSIALGAHMAIHSGKRSVAVLQISLTFEFQKLSADLFFVVQIKKKKNEKEKCFG